MPRNPHPGVSTHRNRNRINNKTRLKIHHGNLDSDALLIPDEDEEKHRLTNLVAGVDAEDANVSKNPPFSVPRQPVSVAVRSMGRLLIRSFPLIGTPSPSCTLCFPA